MTAAVATVELSLTEGPLAGVFAISYGGKIIWRVGERTGTHHCVVCLDVVEREEYFRNDQVAEATP